MYMKNSMDLSGLGFPARTADFDLLIRQGASLLESGELVEAERCYRAAIQERPDFAEAYFKLGVICARRDDLSAAIECYEQAVALDPRYVKALYNMANALSRLSLPVEAEDSYRRAIAADGTYFAAHNNLGVLLLGQGRYQEAEGLFRSVVGADPSDAEAYNNLGLALSGQRQFVAAEAALRQAIALSPRYDSAYNNLGEALRGQGQLDQAEVCYRQAIAIRATYVEAWNNLGVTLKDQGRVDEADICYRQALEADPGYYPARSNLLLNLCFNPASTSEAYLSEALQYESNLDLGREEPFDAWQTEASPNRLRVGLVSGDFRSHSVGWFLDAWLPHVDPGSIELFAYVANPARDAHTDRLQRSFSQWIPIFGLSDAAVAREIHAHGIHVLVDLSGHTAFSRLRTFAFRPAPVQATWLGYCASTGMPSIDYYIADPRTLPPAIDDQFTERVWRLPETYLCFAPPLECVEPSPLPAAFNGEVTFGSFNNLSKLNASVADVWSRVLAAVPGSRLLLKATQLGSEGERERVVAMFGARGIAADRLLLSPATTTRQEHLATYGHVDIALDTFPYPGVTTTMESLWMGVPVLTMTGDRFLSRQGVGLLGAVGLDDWIAMNADDYVAKARAHANDLVALSELRMSLRQRVEQSPLMDGRRFAKDFEQMLWQMWQAR